VTAVERGVSAAGHVIVDMADFPAADQPPAHVCVDRVLSCEVYVGVLGTRYGSPVWDKPEVSYTELEFDTATEAGLDRLMFLLDTDTDNVGIPLSSLIDREYGVRQDAFRRRVQASGLTTQSFGSPAALGQMVERSLRELAEKRRQAAALRGNDDLAVRGRRVLPNVLPAPVLDVEVRGRGQILMELAGLALASRGQVQVLFGLGGSGKSTVARAVAARIAAEGRRVWWVSAADSLSVTQLLLGLAGELGASRAQVEEALAGRLNPSDVLWQQLEERRHWVLVLDNADDPAALQAADRPAASGSGWLRSTRAGLVLVTSRIGDPQTWGPVSHIVRLEPLDDADGAQVLLDLAPAAGDNAAAQSLARQLGGLPLALHQAGSYLASPFAAEATFALYQQALSVRFAELMGRGDEERAKVTATWELSLDALAAQGKGQARPLLRVLSCLASTVPVPPLLLDREVLAQMCGSIAAVEEGLSGLLSVGLIDTPQTSSTGGPPGVKVHPLVAQTIRYLAGDALVSSLNAAVKLLTGATDRLDVVDPQHAADWQALLPHLQVLQFAEERLPTDVEESLMKVAARTCIALIYGGSYVAALAVAESGLKRGGGLAEDHDTVLWLRQNRASAKRYLGRYIEAEAEYRQVLDIELRLVGPDHPDSMSARYELARTLADEGKSADAEVELRRVLDFSLRVLGPDDPYTLSARNSIAMRLSDQGKHAEAEAEFRQVFDTRQRVLGPGHPSTLISRNNIAAEMSDQGKHAEAEAEFRQVFDTKQRVLGPEHPSTLTTRSNIAGEMSDQGKHAEAEAEFRQVFDTQQRVLGPEHPHTLITGGNIARVLAAQGKHAEAAAELRRVFDTQLRVLGPHHPATLLTADFLSRVQREQ